MPYFGVTPSDAAGADLDGKEFILDADADTTITADTDDQIDIKISGADDFQFTANTFTVLSGSTLAIASGATIANSGTATGFGGSDPSSADGDSLGTASAEWSDLYLADGSVIYFGNDQDITLTHVADTGLDLKRTTGTNRYAELTLQTGESDVAVNDVLGKLSFQAPDEGTGTDAILVAAAVQAVSEGNFSSSNNATSLQFMTGASEAATAKMHVKSDGKVGVGTASPGALFHSYTTDNDGTLKHEATGGNAEIVIAGNRTSNADIGHLRFYNNGGSANIGSFRVERNAANNSGNMKLQCADAGTLKDLIKLDPLDGNPACIMDHPGSSQPYTLQLNMTGAAPDDNSQYFMRAQDSGTVRLTIWADGDIVNHDNSYGAISDERIKQNIKDANSQWDDIKAVRVRNFKKKDDTRKYGEDAAWEQIGVVAQELEEISPKLVKQGQPTASDILSNSVFGTLYEEGDDIPDEKEIGDIKSLTGEKVKSVQYSVLYMKAVKALQECMTRIETLESEVAALKG